MPDPRSVMKEFRFLDQKRQTEGLTADEEIRYGELRDLVGGETGAAGSKPGFDVSAAAARLRESLLPAGLRNRPPPAPEPSPEPFGEIEPPAEEQPAEAAYEEQPYAATEEQAQAGEGLFDPGSLAQEGAYDPNAAWDPNAAAYDPNAAAAWDPNAAAAYDPNAAAAYDPNAAAAYDPNAAAAWDPNAAAYDPNAAAAWDPNAAAAYDPNAAAAWDPNAAAAYDPNAAAAYDPNAAAAYDPNAAAAWDPNAAAAYDPNAAAAWDPNAAAAYDPNAAAAWDPNAAAAYDPNAAAAYDPNAEAPAMHPEWGDIAADGEGAAGTETPQAEAPAWAPSPGGEYDGASWDAQFGEPGATPAPGEEPVPPPPEPIDFGSYDEAADPGAAPGPELEALLPFDPAAEARIGPEMAETFGDADGGAPVELSGAADLADPNDFHSAEALASTEAPGWQPEPGAIDQGFELASGGSFDASADAAAPEWATAPDAPPDTAIATEAEAAPWDAPAPGEDLAADDGYGSAAPEPAPAAALDFSAPELTDGGDDSDLSWAGNPGNAPAAPIAPAAFEAAAPLAPAPAPELPEEELPTLDGEAIIEEVSADAVEEAAPAEAPAAPYDAAPFATAAVEPAYEAAAYEAPPTEAPEVPVAEPAPVAAEADLAVDVVDEPEPEVLDPGQPAEDFFVHGAHRVVVHTLEGQVKRGFIENADLAAAALDLAAAQGGPIEPVATANVKAIFFMLAPGEQPAAPHGSRVRVTFRDGRQVAGFSPDYREGAFGFYMIPADARTSTGRIWVYQAAVKQVAVS